MEPRECIPDDETDEWGDGYADAVHDINGRRSALWNDGYRQAIEDHERALRLAGMDCQGAPPHAS